MHISIRLSNLILEQPAVRASKDLTLTAVYSRSLKSAQSLAVDSDLELYSDDSGPGKGCSDLLKRSDIQAVIIAFAALHR